MADTQKQKDDFENLAMLGGAKDQTKNIVVASAAEKSARINIANTLLLQGTASLPGLKENKEINSRYGKRLDEISKLTETAKKSGKSEDALKVAAAVNNLRSETSKDKTLSKEAQKLLNNFYSEFQAIMPALLKELTFDNNAQNVYFEQKMVEKWYEQYFRDKMEQTLQSSKTMTDDLINRLTYTRDMAVTASLALKGGEPLSDEVKKALDENKGWTLVWGATNNGTAIRESVPVLNKQN